MLNTPSTSRVLHSIWSNQGISRIEIANRLNLDKSTITNIVSHLIDIGLVKVLAEGKAGPRGGRKPEHLSINGKYACVLGFEIQPYSYKVAVLNLNGDLLFSKEADRVFSKDTFVGEIAEEMETVQQQAGIPVIGAGVGFSGIVDPDHERIFQSFPLKITECYDFYSEISRYSDIPVFIENDANCCSWAELSFHKKEKLSNFLFVLIEFREQELIKTGLGGIAVGLGIALNGKVYYGEDFSAGEFRSVFATPRNPSQFSLSENDILLVNKDRLKFKNFIRELSVNIALLVNALNIKQIIWGGSRSEYAEEISPIMLHAIQENWPYPDTVTCTVRASTFGELTVAYGAAGMILMHLFSLPDGAMTSSIEDQHKVKLMDHLDRIRSMKSRKAGGVAIK
ncbi:MAG: ROK family transcriptional regulator [Spirochaetales bacterium]|nr:ROK family transcriptional regulator [Spirochaetales bacterium]